MLHCYNTKMHLNLQKTGNLKYQPQLCIKINLPYSNHFNYVSTKHNQVSIKFRTGGRYIICLDLSCIPETALSNVKYTEQFTHVNFKILIRFLQCAEIVFDSCSENFENIFFFRFASAKFHLKLNTKMPFLKRKSIKLYCVCSSRPFSEN